MEAAKQRLKGLPDETRWLHSDSDKDENPPKKHLHSNQLANKQKEEELDTNSSNSVEAAKQRLKRLHEATRWLDE